MELHVVAVDVDDLRLYLARKVGAKVTVNDRNVDPVAYI
jgi:propanol-preferring alcohol dehydrogenase